MITSKNLGRLTLGLLAFMTFKTTLGSAEPKSVIPKTRPTAEIAALETPTPFLRCKEFKALFKALAEEIKVLEQTSEKQKSDAAAASEAHIMELLALVNASDVQIVETEFSFEGLDASIDKLQAGMLTFKADNEALLAQIEATKLMAEQLAARLDTEKK